MPDLFEYIDVIIDFVVFVSAIAFVKISYRIGRDVISISDRIIETHNGLTDIKDKVRSSIMKNNEDTLKAITESISLYREHITKLDGLLIPIISQQKELIAKQEDIINKQISVLEKQQALVDIQAQLKIDNTEFKER